MGDGERGWGGGGGGGGLVRELGAAGSHPHHVTKYQSSFVSRAGSSSMFYIT